MPGTRLLYAGAPALQVFAGYREIRAAELGAVGQKASRTVWLKDQEILQCDIDLFDAEHDQFPYADDYFELVLACEIIEHLQRDPMHMLFEIHRVLEDGGSLLITTPNCASIASIECILYRVSNPYTYSVYPDPAKNELGAGHIREYTPDELARALNCGGFHVETLITEPARQVPSRDILYDLLDRYGFPITLRGEQIYCLAKKDSKLPQTRYPGFLYEQPGDG